MDDRHTIQGLHHITLIAGDVHRNVDFYTGTLGMTFVKKTVNFDAPNTYHLYFGDDVGHPGTVVTFFIWPEAQRGAVGVGGTDHFALGVSDVQAVRKWRRRLLDLGVEVSRPKGQGVYDTIRFHDPDGVVLEIVAEPPRPGMVVSDHDRWTNEPDEMWPEPVDTITPGMAILGIHHISAISSDLNRTDVFYREALGLKLLERDVDLDGSAKRQWTWGAQGDHDRGIVSYFQGAERNSGEQGAHARLGRGQTHHLAFEAADDEALEAWQAHLRLRGIQVTPIMDRSYFHSIYFTDPDGHILEIATTVPGFLIDQPRERLGKDLALPPWLEDQRSQIEAGLPPLNLAAAAGVP